MGLFGHSSRILIAADDVSAAVASWLLIGFTVLASDDTEPPSWTRLTDGQIVLTVMQTDAPSPALAYFSASVPRVQQRARDLGVPAQAVGQREMHAEGPGGLMVFCHHQDSTEAVRPDRTQNPVIGYFDGLVVNVEDTAAARAWAERAGFLVEDDSAGGHRRIDMTDGVSRLAFLQSTLAGRSLAYVTDIDDDLVADLDEAFGADCEHVTAPDGSLLFLRLTMADGTTVSITPDD